MNFVLKHKKIEDLHKRKWITDEHLLDNNIHVQFDLIVVAVGQIYENFEVIIKKFFVFHSLDKVIITIKVL
jgi:hypothetical protein